MSLPLRERQMLLQLHGSSRRHEGTQSYHNQQAARIMRTPPRSSLFLSSSSLVQLVVIGLWLVCCCTTIPTIHAERIDYNLILEPTPLTIHYSDFYVRGPGIIDLSKLQFAAVTDDTTYSHHDKSTTQGDDTTDGDDDDDDTVTTAGDDDGGDDTATADDDGEAAMHDKKDPSGGTSKKGSGITSTGSGGGNKFSLRERPTVRRMSVSEASSSASWWTTLVSLVVSKEPSPTRDLLAVASSSPRSSSSSKPKTTSSKAPSVTTIDMVSFRLPPSCSSGSTSSTCDWTSLGLGAKHDDGTLRWCCTVEAQALGMCLHDKQKLGRLIYDPNLLSQHDGEHRVIQVNNNHDSNNAPTSLHDVPKVPAEESGKYVLVMASCGDGGYPVIVTGTASIQSVHGYLPGELYGFLFFYAALTILYFVLVLWYGGMMHLNEESRIPIEKWIFTTIVLGMLEMVFKLGNVYVWNEDGYQEQWIALVGVMFGVLKQGWSRCLMVMVSLGWGVTRDSLGRKLKWIVVAGMMYVGVSAARDVSLIVAVENVQELSQTLESGLFDLYTILTFVNAALDVLFAMWILDSLASTMEYLEGMKQSRKLKRYLRLRCLFLFAVLFGLLWVVFALVNSMSSGIVEEEDAWIVEGATEVNYFIVLVGVACLWRPNPSAREYAYALELSSSRDDDATGVTELELTSAVPSAMDDDDEYDDEHFADAITPPGRSNVRNGGYVD